MITRLTGLKSKTAFSLSEYELINYRWISSNSDKPVGKISSCKAIEECENKGPDTFKLKMYPAPFAVDVAVPSAQLPL